MLRSMYIQQQELSGYQVSHFLLHKQLNTPKVLYFCKLLKLVFDDVCHHILDVDACGTHLLRDEAGSRHARRGIDFQHIDFLSLGNAVVSTHDSLSAHNVIDG